MRGAVFIHRGRRTGGTAVMDAFDRAPGVASYYDALHPELAMPWSEIQHHAAEAWSSGHPGGFRYHETFEALVVDDRVAHFHERFPHIDAMESDDEDDGFHRYIDRMIAASCEGGRVPVIGFETGEFLIPWLRSHFPDAVHIGVTRSPSATLASWIFQAVMGNTYFIDEGAARVRRMPERFGFAPQADLGSLDLETQVALATSYIETTNAVRASACDGTIAIDLLPEEAAIASARAAAALPDGTWDAVLARLASSRPPRDLVSQLLEAATHVSDLTDENAALRMHSEAHAREAAAAARSLEQALAETQSHAQDLSIRLAEVEPYTYRPSLALGVIRANAVSALRSRLRRADE